MYRHFTGAVAHAVQEPRLRKIKFSKAYTQLLKTSELLAEYNKRIGAQEKILSSGEDEDYLRLGPICKKGEAREEIRRIKAERVPYQKKFNSDLLAVVSILFKHHDITSRQVMERSKELLSELKTLSDKVFCALYGTLSGVTVLATGAIGMKLASAPELARAVAFIVALVLTGISVFEFFSNLHLRAHRESIEFAVKKLEKALQAKLHGRNEWI